jgi:hypothetical protein
MPWEAEGSPSRPVSEVGREYAGALRSDPSDLVFYRGRYWFRTSDLCRVKAALSR